MTDNPNENTQEDAINTDGIQLPRRAYITLVGGGLVLSGGTPTPATAGNVSESAVKNIATTNTGGYGSGAYGDGLYGGGGDESSGTVEIESVEITPETVNNSNVTHNLKFEVSNLSDDGEPDNFSIAMPEEVELDAVVNVESEQFDTTVSNESNPIEFMVNSEEGEPTVGEFEVAVEFSPAAE